MSKNIVTILSIIITVIVAIIAGWKQTTIDDLKSQLLISKNIPPKVITITDTRVIYTDSSKTHEIIINKPPEAKVTIDQEKYAQLVAEVDRINNELRLAKEQTFIDTTGYANKKLYTQTVDSLSARLVNIMEQLRKPQESGIISIDRSGFIFRPIMGIEYGGKVSPFIGGKIFFVKEYGLIVGSSAEHIGIGVSRYIYDLVPWIKNTQGFIMLGLPYHSKGGNISMGVAVNL